MRNYKMKFGLNDTIIERIQQVFESNSKIDKVIVFGSRAKGNYKEGSDIDLAVKGRHIDFKEILHLSGQLDELNLPYSIDLLHYAAIKDKEVVEHIDRIEMIFYERWKKYKFSDLIDLIGGGTPKTNVSDYWNGNIPWLSVVDFNNGNKYVFQTEKTITEKGLKNSSTKLLNKDDIIISARGTVGATSVLGKTMAFNQSCYGLRAKKELIQEYLYYLLNDSIHNLLQISHGGVFDTITKETFESINVTIPPKKEQRNIASTLSSLDDKIDLLQRQNKTLEQLAETLFRQWFVEEADESWEEKKLGELLTVTSAKRIFYSEYVSSGIPFYRSKEIIELRNTGTTNSELYISDERFNEINHKFGSPQEGDILMTSVGTLGVAYRVRKSDKFYFKDGNLTWFKDFKGLPSSIVYLWLISKIGQEQLASITIGSTQEALTIEGLKSISFKIPPKNKIHEYEKEFNTIIHKMEFNQKQIQQLTELRDELLPKLMNGEVRIKN